MDINEAFVEEYERLRDTEIDCLGDAERMLRRAAELSVLRRACFAASRERDAIDDWLRQRHHVAIGRIPGTPMLQAMRDGLYLLGPVALMDALEALRSRLPLDGGERSEPAYFGGIVRNWRSRS